MKSLLRFLLKYHLFIVFSILEIIAFSMITRYNTYHRAKMYNLRHFVLGGISEKFSGFNNYLQLTSENKALIEENIKLYNLLPPSYFNPIAEIRTDTLQKQYLFIGARVVNNSTNKPYNFITLNKGRLDGIQPEMAVICDKGIVGLVKETSDHFSSVISILNNGINPSGMLKKSGYFGPIEWTGHRYNEVILTEIPLHVNLEIGDTVITTGYKGIFPQGIMIGTIKSFKSEQGISYRITVELSADMKNISNVLVVNNLLKKEQQQLEEASEHD